MGLLYLVVLYIFVLYIEALPNAPINSNNFLIQLGFLYDDHITSK